MSFWKRNVVDVTHFQDGYILPHTFLHQEKYETETHTVVELDESWACIHTIYQFLCMSHLTCSEKPQWNPKVFKSQVLPQFFNYYLTVHIYLFNFLLTIKNYFWGQKLTNLIFSYSMDVELILFKILCIGWYRQCQKPFLKIKIYK